MQIERLAKIHRDGYLDAESYNPTSSASCKARWPPKSNPLRGAQGRRAAGSPRIHGPGSRRVVGMAFFARDFGIGAVTALAAEVGHLGEEYRMAA